MIGGGWIAERRLLAVCAAMLLAGCADQDPFGLARREVAGGYRLQRFESDVYYLVGRGTSVTGGGALDGVVDRIGWDGRYILASRKSTPGGPVNGWMIVDTRTGAVTGPVSEAQAARDPRVSGIRPLPAFQAYDGLDGSTPRRLVLLYALPLAAIAGLAVVGGRWRKRGGGGAGAALSGSPGAA